MWMTCTDRFSGRRGNLLVNLMVTDLDTHHLLSSPTPLTAHRIMGERGDVPASEVTAILILFPSS